MTKITALTTTPARAQAIVAMLQQDRRLSNACKMFTDGALPEQFHLPAEIASALPALIVAERARCAPAALPDITGQLTAVMSLLGGMMSQDDRTAYITVAAIDLQPLPGDLVLEALTVARQKLDDIRKVLPFVFDYCGEQTANRRQRVTELIGVARAAGLQIDG